MSSAESLAEVRRGTTDDRSPTTVIINSGSAQFRISECEFLKTVNHERASVNGEQLPLIRRSGEGEQ